MRRDHWKRRNDMLDPHRDFVEIYRNVVMHEFPWDMEQALSFALFRTYAVPGIGRLLAATGAFTEQTQKRYDDTVLLLEPPTRLGFDHPEARAAIRRVNQMHRSYDIPQHELRYVLSTFVVVPKRWLDRYGKRPLSPHEVIASVEYYSELARHMGISDAPATYAAFEELLDDYEAEHFAYDPGGRAVADSTLALMATFQPKPVQRLMDTFGRCFMEPDLLAAFRYDAPPGPVVTAARAGLRLRGRALRAFPARRHPVTAQDKAHIRSCPDGAPVTELGTFPVPGEAGCPVRHAPGTGRTGPGVTAAG
ncbi:oxygenase MpaB family protein [Nocardioides jishulii]|uniref:DUF2236 domain-containing protein n=1 Tax=Nocardioides jishulii TaxID=2575440 RepID=A0A4U2YN27_9ACTN|nr:oxygenase MpaB family protein [Nocardioides jishulii]QCX27862.1 DUF2236 domain-containing protein [Nocardioides jishulii]TKI62669.1 DUF2236 domain-containing protein [Nocardioides jishulii]